ncbi:MAG TPA: contact-dependent growth inhibition system immunity protein [Verrucomicrobiae bacterium]|jgi:hypothetical protein|nr:contact-dependent growth inhibition system immunity protein [Verrucomicrobiae bacterium]
MNKSNLSEITFALLDKERGVEDSPPTPDDDFPLPAWYRSIRATPLDKLSIEDVSKACRQQIYSEYVVPIALNYLTSDPLVGEMYDGELLVSLKCIEANYWLHHPDETKRAILILEKALSCKDMDQEFYRDAKSIMEILTASAVSAKSF